MRRASSLIKYHNGDLNAAAHDLRIGLQSIQPYTDRASSAVLDLIQFVNAGTPERQARLVAQLHTLAATPEVQP